MNPEEAYKYCELCGGEYIKQAQFNKLICSKCNYTKYLTPIPCNGIILTDLEGKIILTKRSVNPNIGKWDVIGGFCDLNENLEESVVRETAEEVGLVIDPKKIEYLVSLPERYIFSKNINNYLGLYQFVYTEKVDVNKLTPHDDVGEIKSFSVNEIPWDDIATETIRELIRVYLRSKKLLTPKERFVILFDLIRKQFPSLVSASLYTFIQSFVVAGTVLIGILIILYLLLNKFGPVIFALLVRN
jgi:ADP-ribose pyrophosphatase YjhB (NUDIX family)